MSLLSRLLSRSTPGTNKPHTPPRSRLGVQVLEDRTTPAVGFDSAFDFGGSPGSHRGLDIASDAAGNTYLTGYFTGTVDFDPNRDTLGGADVRTALGARDIFVAKYAPDNALVWVTRMGGAAISETDITVGLDGGYSLSLDAAGNVLVAGQFHGSADFGPVTLTSAGNRDAFAAKLSPVGNVVWAKSWGTAQADSASGIDADAAGNVYATGFRITAPDNSAKFTDVVKFAANGTQSWMKSFQTQESHADLAVDPAGNVYVAGGFDGTVDFDPAPNKTKYLYDGTGQAGTFVLKLTSAGNFGWASAFQANREGSVSGYAYAYPKSIALDAGNNVVIGGYYHGVVDFDPGSKTNRLPDNGNSQGFVTKLTSAGGFAWANGLASTTSSMAHGVAVDAAGNVYATGGFKGTVDLDPRANTTDTRTATGAHGGTFIVRYTANGGYGWGGAFVGSGYGSAGSGIAVDPAGTISVVGYFEGTTDFDPDALGTHEVTTPAGQTRVYVAKLRQS
jgi:hypothetical protein